MNREKAIMNNEFTWIAWFSLAAGMIVLALLPNFGYGIFGYAGWAITSLVALGAVIVLTRGWLMLSISSKKKHGQWPDWGLFEVLPWIAFAFSVVVMLFITVSLCLWIGSMLESAALTSVPTGLGWQDYFLKIGYVVVFASFLWTTLRTIFLQASKLAKRTKDKQHAPKEKLTS